MSQLDLFPDSLIQVYRSNDCFDLTEPPMEMDDPTNKFSKHLAKRIKLLKSLPKDRYYIFANRGDIPYVYDKKFNKKVSPNHTQRMYTSVKLLSKSYYMHLLVAMFFLENDAPDIKIQVDHLNNCATDYTLENLEWVTQSENLNRAIQRRKDGTT